MLLLKRTVFTTLFLLVLSLTKLGAQCTFTSSCGYTVNLRVVLLNIVPSSTDCTSGPGYNYNLRFAYTVTAVGTNTCSDGTLGVQPQIFCNSGQNNGYYTISNYIPTGVVSVTDSGTLTTTTNPYRNVADCNSSTPTSLGCNSMQVTIFGPGIPTATFPCTLNYLPIELYEFFAMPLNNAVLIKWSTASERDNSFFTLERSGNGESWQEIKKIKGAGTSRMQKHYESYDYDFIKGHNYYRLKQTDFDGAFKYSGIFFVDALNAAELSIFPNPVTDQLNIIASDEQARQVQVLNTQGEVLYSQELESGAAIPMGDYPKGVYILRIRNGNQDVHRRFIKE